MIDLIKYLSLIFMLICAASIPGAQGVVATVGFLGVYILCVLDEYNRGKEHDRKMGRT